jgi:hypothetical protein
MTAGWDSGGGSGTVTGRWLNDGGTAARRFGASSFQLSIFSVCKIFLPAIQNKG